MRRFLLKKTGDCGSPPTPKKPKADSERLVAAREYEDRRRRGFKAAWHDEFAWLTYGPAPADSDSNVLHLIDLVLGRMWERIFGDEANQDRRPEPIDGECPVSWQTCWWSSWCLRRFQTSSQPTQSMLGMWQVIAHADQTTKRLAALAVPLVMLVYQTQSRRV